LHDVRTGAECYRQFDETERVSTNRINLGEEDRSSGRARMKNWVMGGTLTADCTCVSASGRVAL